MTKGLLLWNSNVLPSTKTMILENKEWKGSGDLLKNKK